MSPTEIVWLIWIVIICGLLGLLTALLIIIVWRWMHVTDHIKVSLASDVAEVDITKPVNFTGTVVDDANTPQAGKNGTLDGTAPDGSVVSLPFTTDENGAFSVAWTAVLPVGEWAFKATVETVESNVVTITQRAAVVGDTAQN